MPQTIGNHNYQVYAKNSSGVYSSPLTLNQIVTSCLTGAGFFASGTTLIGQQSGATGTFKSGLSGAQPYSNISSSLFLRLKRSFNQSILFGLSDNYKSIKSIDKNTGLVTDKLTLTDIIYDFIILPNGETLLVKTNNAGEVILQKYSNSGTLISSATISATPFSGATLDVNLDGSAVYVATNFNTTGTVSKYLTSNIAQSQQVWLVAGLGSTSILATKDSREQIWITDNGSAGNANIDLFRKLNKDTGATEIAMTDSPYTSGIDLAITPDQRTIFSSVVNVQPGSSKIQIVKIDTLTNIMTTFVNNFYGTTLSVSPDGLILYAGRGQDSAGVRAYNINTGALIDTYPGFASLQVLLSA